MNAAILHRSLKSIFPCSLLVQWPFSCLDWQQKRSLSVYQGLILLSNPDFTGVSCPAIPAVTISAVAHAVPWNRSWEERQNWETQIITLQVLTCFLSSHPLDRMCKGKPCTNASFGATFSGVLSIQFKFSPCSGTSMIA